MKPTILLFLVTLLNPFHYLYSQTCAPNCKQTITNGTGKISVNYNDIICLQGTFNGEIDMLGGTLFICANANISQVTFKQPSKFVCNNGIIRVQRVSSQNGSKDIFLENHADSLVISQVNADSKFEIVNSGTCYLSNTNFNRECNITNTGRMNINGSLRLNASSKFINNGVLAISGNVINNSGQLFIQSGCQTTIGQSLLLNQSSSIVRITEGQFTAASLNVNNGKIELNNSSLLKVTSLTLSGFIEGIGTRSTVQCVNVPNLNAPSSIRGNVSLCVTSGAYNPNPGTITPPAAIDCNNLIGSSTCILNPTGYEFFKLKNNNATTWNLDSNWLIWVNNQWVNATNGRFPTKTSVVLIDENKSITSEEKITIKRLILGGSNGFGRINLGEFGGSLIVSDSTQFLHFLSVIDAPQNNVELHGYFSDTLRLSGGSFTSFLLDETTPNNHYIQWTGNTNENKSLYSLTYNVGSIRFSDTTFIHFYVKPISGTLFTQDKLVLTSGPTRTASILAGNGSNYINGKVKIQQYIPSIARRFRFLAPSVTNNTFADWQDDIFITGNNASGTAVGNIPGTLNSAGFDATGNNSPTAYFYNETITGNKNNGWNAQTNETNTLADLPLPIGKGYRVFIRGDRSDIGRLDGTNNTQNEVTLDLFGTIFMGDFNFPLNFTANSGVMNDGWNLIGNPYPSAYDWSTFYQENKTYQNIEPNIWIYSPSNNSYFSYNAISKAGSLKNGIIPAGQSFWVKATNINPQLVFNEKYKVADQGSSYLRSSTLTNDVLKLTLYKDSINSDRVIFKFNTQASKSKDSLDIIKFWSDIGIAAFDFSDSVYLDLSCRPVDYFNADIIPLYFYGDVSGNYEIRAQIGNAFKTANTIYLFDKYANSYINLKTNSTYAFSIDKSISQTEGFDRFYLVYLPAMPDASQITYFFAEDEDTAGYYLEWATSSEPFPITMRLQRADNISSFQTINMQQSSGDPLLGGRYGYYDTITDKSTTRYYRIELSDSVFGTRYSTIIKVNGLTGLFEIIKTSEVILFPNPTVNEVNIQFPEVYDVPVQLDVLDIVGMHIHSELIIPNDGLARLNVNEIPPGVYTLRLSYVDGTSTFYSKLIKQ